MKLDDGPGPAVGRVADVAIEARLAVAQDAARRVPRGVRDGVVEPGAIAGGDQHLGVDAAERLGVGVLDLG